MNRQRLLLDLSPLKMGGGVQLALNFIDYISNLDRPNDLVILVSNEFPFIERLPTSCPVVTFSSSPIKRLYQEHKLLPQIIENYHISHSFTFFGLGLPKQKNVRQVVSVAYPTICYDDSPFWQQLSIKDYIKKKIFQYFRLYRIGKADAVIVETNVMKKRMQSQLQCNSDKFHIIPPVPTSYVQNVKTPYTPDDTKFKCLVLSGLNEHKNVWRLIEVARILDQKNCRVTLVISVEENYFREKYSALLAQNSSLDFLHVFDFRGSIAQDKIQDVYTECDVLLNVSDLESFSNNYMEAWLSNTPIISSDRDFARDILGFSAIYCEPHEPETVYQAIIEFIAGKYNINEMLEEGKRRLAKLPTIEERWHAVQAVIYNEAH